MATKLGAISSLQKPFRPVELLAAVSRCLDAAMPSLPASRVPSGDMAGHTTSPVARGDRDR